MRLLGPAVVVLITLAAGVMAYYFLFVVRRSGARPDLPAREPPPPKA